MPNNEEQEFRDRLHDYVSPVDAEATWLAVQANLKPKKKRRLGGWWITLLLLLLGGVVYAVCVGPASLKTQLNAERGQNGQDGLRNNRDKAMGSSTTPDNPAPTEVKSGETKVKSVTSAKDQISPKKTSQKKTKARTLPEILTVPNTPVTPKAYLRPVSEPLLLLQKQTPPEPGNQDPAAVTKPEIIALPDSPIIMNPIDDGEPATMPLPVVNNGILPRSNNQTAIKSLPPKEYSLSSQFDIPDLSATLPEEDLSAQKFKSSRKAYWLMGLETTFSSIDQTFGQNTPDAESRLSLYNELIDPLQAISLDISIGYRTRSGWSISSGVGYTRINTVAGAVTTTVNDTFQTEGIVRVDVTSGGDSLTTSDLVSGIQRNTRIQRYYNHLNLIDLPLLLGKRFYAGRFVIDVEVGPVLNVLSNGSARLPDSPGIFSQREQNALRFRPNLGVGYRGKFAVGYRLTNRYTLLGGVRYHDYLRAVENPGETVILTRYRLTGGSIGLRMQL